MKSAFYSAYVAGLCPLTVMMEMGKYKPGSRRTGQSDSTCEGTATDFARATSQRQHAHAFEKDE